MKPIKELHTADDDRIIVAHTDDGVFERPTMILCPVEGEVLSMDVMLQYDGIYHIARLNIVPSTTDKGKLNIDICLPDGNKMDAIQWNNGARIIDIHQSNKMLALVISPAELYTHDKLG